MTTITRERLEQIYAECEERDPAIFEIRELVRIALASLTAEPVAWRLVDSPESSVTVTDNEKMAAIWKRNGRNVQPLYSTAHGSADAVGMVVSEGRQPSAHNPDSRIFEVLVESGYEPVPGDKLYAAPPASERERIRREHAEWSDATFGDVGQIGPLKHLSKEAMEAAADPSDPLEWADMQFLLWDAQRRAGITDEQITQAMIEKLAINKARQWPEPKDGEPRLHIKEQPAPVISPDLHPDTQKLVTDFCTALAEKLYKAQLKYGYDADWKQDGWATQCLLHFHQHIAKGDPRDVAAYCAFMWYHGWKTESASGPVVPEEITDESTEQRLMGRRWAHSFCAGWNACRAAMLSGGKS